MNFCSANVLPTLHSSPTDHTDRTYPRATDPPPAASHPLLLWLFIGCRACNDIYNSYKVNRCKIVCDATQNNSVNPVMDWYPAPRTLQR